MAKHRQAVSVLIRDTGMRATRQRLDVLDVLAREQKDMTAQEIHARLREEGAGVGLATVYRTLASLAEHDVVDTLGHRRRETSYRLCREEHHHHLICTSCQRVVELGECNLEGWLESASAAHGFVPTEHVLEVSGLCASCRTTG
jgi:Fur family transcriptional regulator, ferric uptake regulator